MNGEWETTALFVGTNFPQIVDIRFHRHPSSTRNRRSEVKGRHRPIIPSRHVPAEITSRPDSAVSSFEPATQFHSMNGVVISLYSKSLNHARPPVFFPRANISE